MHVVDLHPSPVQASSPGRSTVLGYAAAERLGLVLVALAGLWLAIAAVLGWLG